jgi:DNA-binding NarL/FixJ family response regulator
MQKKITVAIVDDHTLLRAGLRSLLERMEDIEVVASGASGEEAVNILSIYAPDVFLMDIMMHGMDGIQATRWIKEQSPQTKVILISGEVNKEYIAAGLKAGISGYLPKDTSREKLVDAIRTVQRGEEYFSDEIKSLVFTDFFLTQTTGKGLPKKKSSELSEREQAVLVQIAQGKALREVADALFISVKTVETHKQHIYEKLNLKNTAQLVLYALQHKLV